MLKLQGWLLSLLVLAFTVTPVMAGDNDTKTENETTANTISTGGSPAAATPALTPGDASVKALLGLLVSKGVLNAE